MLVVVVLVLFLVVRCDSMVGLVVSVVCRCALSLCVVVRSCLLLLFIGVVGCCCCLRFVVVLRLLGFVLWGVCFLLFGVGVVGRLLNAVASCCRLGVCVAACLYLCSVVGDV